ncbi:LOW QUALITY PROTEIN: carboxypeptidase B-like [Uloborus diversus]|uniref:LOW QUALITY PROTEIN: carboxypeptidase B-like n=1 Tax=Uloborus diversus TaxID=327109 RepID=UPI002409AC99|nr:LOW QUALITY PROTEIN: carboxypeptidase B-like [Uloborus diversus]
MFKQLFFFVLCTLACSSRVDYTGHKVLTVSPSTKEHISFLENLRSDYGVDLWNEPKGLDVPVMIHLKPELIHAVEHEMRERGISYNVAFDDLERVIQAERIQNGPSDASSGFDFSRYNEYDKIVNLLKDLSTEYPTLAKLVTAGNSFENRPIYNLKISSGDGSSKPAVAIECGIHAREWSSVAACAYFVNRLLSTYNSDPTVKGLVDKYEFNVIVESNPDGYVYTWEHDRMWRKTRSKSSADWLGVCRGTDANRNFDVEHCGVGTSRKPCEEIYCGDRPFSESEARAIRDLMIALKSRIAAYFSIHAFFPTLDDNPMAPLNNYPPNYSELQRIGNAGATALAKKYGTRYRVGSIANIIYEAAGSSVDYAYIKQDIKIAYALELRDTGRYGFFLPQNQILPTCEETFEGLQAAILAL